MPITVTRENGRTKIRGSETYSNGMTMTFHGPDEVVSMSKGQGERVQGIGRTRTVNGNTYLVQSTSAYRNPNLRPQEATPRSNRSGVTRLGR